MKKQIILTFDLEEFDLPLEFGCPISEDDQINISNNGLQQLTGLLSKFNIHATFFTTSFYANRNKEIVRNLSLNHEIASHSKHHSQFREDDLSDSKTELEKITGKQVYGFRMPRLKKVDFSIIKEAGYIYDSSLHPTYIPGRYNNLLTRRKIYHDIRSKLIEFPISVSPLIRFPLFWLSFKTIPFPVYLNLCKQALWKDSYLHLYFHPWEFAELKSFNIPGYIKNPSGEEMVNKFERLMVEFKKAGYFSTISGFLDTKDIIRLSLP